MKLIFPSLSASIVSKLSPSVPPALTGMDSIAPLFEGIGTSVLALPSAIRFPSSAGSPPPAVAR